MYRTRKTLEQMLQTLHSDGYCNREHDVTGYNVVRITIRTAPAYVWELVLQELYQRCNQVEAYTDGDGNMYVFAEAKREIRENGQLYKLCGLYHPNHNQHGFKLPAWALGLATTGDHGIIVVGGSK